MYQLQIKRLGQFVNETQQLNALTLKELAVFIHNLLNVDEISRVLANPMMPCRIECGLSPARLYVGAWSPSGGTINVSDLCRWGENQTRDARLLRWKKRHWGCWKGAGPVPGTSKARGGSNRRHPHTQNERKLNQVGCDYGLPVRGSRKPGYLPTSWSFWDDDIWVPQRERNWKSQRHGCKSWDR